MKSIARMRILIYSAAIVMAPAAAHADFINGYAWVTTESNSQNAAPATLSSSTCSHGTATCTTGNADVSFTTTGVNFPLQGSGTIGAWLASSTFTLDNLVDSVATSALDPTIWEFAGNISVTNGETFTFGHDDGVTFIVNGQTVVNQPGPTGFVSTPGTYTGATNNNAAFELVYGECCGGGAGLSVSLLGPTSAPAVPEPAMIPLLALGMASILLFRRLRRVA